MKSRALPFLLAALSVLLLTVRLSAIYTPPAAPTSTIDVPVHIPTPATSLKRSEDAELFNAALRVSLLRQDAAGKIMTAPADLPLRRRWAEQQPELLTAVAVGEPDWLAMQWNQEVSRLHRALHFSSTGRYIREQIQAFNEQRRQFLHIQRQGAQLIWRERR